MFPVINVSDNVLGIRQRLQDADLPQFHFSIFWSLIRMTAFLDGKDLCFCWALAFLSAWCHAPESIWLLKLGYAVNSREFALSDRLGFVKSRKQTGIDVQVLDPITNRSDEATVR